MPTTRTRIVLALSAVVLTTAVVVTGLYVAGVGTMLQASIGGGAQHCSPLLGALSVLPQPFDPSVAPLTVAVDGVAAGARVTAEIRDEYVTHALFPLEGEGARRAGIWSGRDLSQHFVPDGQYALRVGADSGACHEERAVSVIVRRSLVPFLELRPSERVLLGSRTTVDDDDSGARWASSDETVARVEDGRTVVGVAPGIVQLSTDAPDGTWQMHPLEVHVVR